MEENKVAQDSSAPNSPEMTRLSGEQAEERTAREGRAKEWLEAQRVFVPFYRLEMEALLTKYAASECSRLASRVEELENLIAKQPGCSRCNDSASGSTSNRAAKEIR